MTVSERDDELRLVVEWLRTWASEMAVSNNQAAKRCLNVAAYALSRHEHRKDRT